MSCLICGSSPGPGEAPLLPMPCELSHMRCNDCFLYGIQLLLKDESLYPPRCCRKRGAPTDIDNYKDIIPRDLIGKYKEKELEYKIPRKSRVYCAVPTCSKFLHPQTFHPGDVALCKDCNLFTCIKCRNLVDTNTSQAHVCALAKEDQVFLKYAEKKKFKRCPNCGVTVELREACNHIHCECKTEFCYVCGRIWPGAHGCPKYGTATYDAEGYNQEGYHRDTGLNRAGKTRLEAERPLHARFALDDLLDDERWHAFRETLGVGVTERAGVARPQAPQDTAPVNRGRFGINFHQLRFWPRQQPEGDGARLLNNRAAPMEPGREPLTPARDHNAMVDRTAAHADGFRGRLVDREPNNRHAEVRLDEILRQVDNDLDNTPRQRILRLRRNQQLAGQEDTVAGHQKRVDELTAFSSARRGTTRTDQRRELAQGFVDYRRRRNAAEAAQRSPEHHRPVYAALGPGQFRNNVTQRNAPALSLGPLPGALPLRRRIRTAAAANALQNGSARVPPPAPAQPTRPVNNPPVHPPRLDTPISNPTTSFYLTNTDGASLNQSAAAIWPPDDGSNPQDSFASFTRTHRVPGAYRSFTSFSFADPQPAPMSPVGQPSLIGQPSPAYQLAPAHGATMSVWERAHPVPGGFPASFTSSFGAEGPFRWSAAGQAVNTQGQSQGQNAQGSGPGSQGAGSFGAYGNGGGFNGGPHF